MTEITATGRSTDTYVRSLVLLPCMRSNTQGIFKWANGDSYEGEVKGGQKHGKVCHLCNSGRYGFHRHRRQGVHRFANGDYYVGEWKDGELVGEVCSTTRTSLPICS